MWRRLLCQSITEDTTRINGGWWSAHSCAITHLALLILNMDQLTVSTVPEYIHIQYIIAMAEQLSQHQQLLGYRVAERRSNLHGEIHLALFDG